MLSLRNFLESLVKTEMGRSADYDRDAAKAAKNSPTLIGAAIGTAGGPLWALAGTGVANLATDFRTTDWNTLNLSAAFLLILINVSLVFASLAVASRCASAGAGEYFTAVLFTTPYVIYRALSPCQQPPPPGLLAAALAPAALVRIAGGRA